MEIKSCKNVCEEGMKETNLTVPVLRISINIYWKTLRIGTERTRTTPSQNQHRDDLTSAQYSLFPLHSTKHMKQISTSAAHSISWKSRALKHGLKNSLKGAGYVEIRFMCFMLCKENKKDCPEIKFLCWFWDCVVLVLSIPSLEVSQYRCASARLRFYSNFINTVRQVPTINISKTW